jgi:NAD(P)-dependent dehydrogenase (short-subunit alcohol dehydrogenase family)
VKIKRSKPDPAPPLWYEEAVTPLAGRTALITGAAKRVGREIALAFAREGVNCLLHYNRSIAHVADTERECRELGVRAESLRADLADPASIEQAARDAADRGADILVHNASAFFRLPFLESPIAVHRERIQRDLTVHVTAPYLLSRILGERMVQSGWGRIIVIGDWTAEASVYPHYASYIVSKSAVPALVKVLALELGGRCPEVTANAILPGPIIPPEGHDPADTDLVKRQTILGDWIGPEGIVRSVLFLSKSGEITGESLRVDGGRSVKAL